MVPAVTVKRTKTVSIVVFAAATILAALWLGPRAPRRRSVVTDDVHTPGDPCAVAVTSRLTSNHVLIGDHEDYLAVTLRAPSCGQTLARPPMSVALVIDHSGSMRVPDGNGEMSPEALEAAKSLVDMLKPTDAFSLVGYAQNAEVLTPMTFATQAAKDAAKLKIATLFADGGTNISDGLSVGNRQLTASPIENGVRRIILVSDGAPTEGIGADVDRGPLIRFTADLAGSGTSISAVGLGREFEESTMINIAAAGRGNYYFVKNSKALTEMFTAEMTSAGKTVAADAELALIPGTGAVDELGAPLEILEVYGYGARKDGATWYVPIADLAAGETRKIVARVRVRGSTRGPLDVATARLSYRPIAAHDRVDVVATARAEVTGEAEVVRAGIDLGTMKLVEEAQTAQVIDKAAEVYKHEGYAGARRVLDAHMQQVEATAAAYGDDGIAGSSREASRGVLRNFAAAPPASPEGSMAGKGASKTAYDLSK